MTLERYQELLQNKAAYKIGKDGKLCIKSPNGKMLIEIFCIPIETYVELYKELDWRILFFVYPVLSKDDYPDAALACDIEPIIVSDFEEQRTALSYALLIDEKNETVSLRLNDFPEQGKIFISENEIAGITKKLWKSCGTQNRMSESSRTEMSFNTAI